MNNLKRYLLKFSVLTLTAICSLSMISGAIAETIGPYKYSCKNGRVFKITFIKEKGEKVAMKAILVFLKNNTREFLKYDLGKSGDGRGDVYQNGKYRFSQYEGVTFFEDKKSNTDCKCTEIE